MAEPEPAHLSLAVRWWKERRGGGQCDTKDKGGRDNANELNFDSVGGVFVVLIAGMGCACAISVLEFIWKGASLEKKAKVKPASLVAKALYNTNSNLFNVAGIQKQTNTDQTACPHGRVTIPCSVLSLSNCPHLVSEAEHLSCRHPGPAGRGGGGRRGGGRGGAALAAAEPRVPALRVPRPHHGPLRPDVRAPAPTPAPATSATSCQVDSIHLQ